MNTRVALKMASIKTAIKNINQNGDSWYSFGWTVLKSPTKKIATCKFSVYFYETVAQTSHKNINKGIFENILKNTEKKSISHIDVYGANGPKWTFSLIFWNILKYSLIYIFVRYLSYGLLKVHRKLTSGYLLCDNASLNPWGTCVASPIDIGKFMKMPTFKKKNTCNSQFSLARF
jgi:hypothetical protein